MECLGECGIAEDPVTGTGAAATAGVGAGAGAGGLIDAVVGCVEQLLASLEQLAAGDCLQQQLVDCINDTWTQLEDADYTGGYIFILIYIYI